MKLSKRFRIDHSASPLSSYTGRIVVTVRTYLTSMLGTMHIRIGHIDVGADRDKK